MEGLGNHMVQYRLEYLVNLPGMKLHCIVVYKLHNDLKKSNHYLRKRMEVAEGGFRRGWWVKWGVCLFGESHGGFGGSHGGFGW